MAEKSIRQDVRVDFLFAKMFIKYLTNIVIYGIIYKTKGALP